MADSEHSFSWEGNIEELKEFFGIKVALLTKIDDGEILSGCRGKDAVIIHCGTIRPMAGIKELLIKIRAEYPNIKIGLETNAIHPHLENLTDFYITKPISIRVLRDELRSSIE